MRWTAVVPVKGLPTAKSRLGARPDAERVALALAFARDVVAAVLATPEVDEVVLVTSDPVVAGALAGADVVVLEEPETDGLNAALAHGADLARAATPAAGSSPSAPTCPRSMPLS